ncbi:MAG TPA: hypothetical protein VNX28_09480 [Gemmataceae bacterium]|nr:hypothetical protein [Gemmataceae bacterium]
MIDNDADTQRLDFHLRITRIVVGAMMMGIVSFLAIAVILVQRGAPNPNQQGILSAMAAAFFALMFLLWWVLPDVAAKNQIERIAAGTWTPGKDPKTGSEIQAGAYPNDAAKLLSVNQTRALIAAALLEGAGFFGCIAYLVEQQIFALGIPGSVILLMALTFPTRNRVVQWLEVQQMCINDRRAERGA